MKITEEKLKGLCEGIDKSIWDVGNEALYSLCKKYPKHEKDSEIIAKVWLVGRSYAAAIERNKVKKEDKLENDVFYTTKVVECFKKPKLDIDLHELEKHKQLTRTSLPEVLCLHKYLVDEVQKIAKQENRSLCSKYLHFHKPELFFIYDSRAASALRLLEGIVGKSDRPKGECDYDYAKFCYGAMKLVDWVGREVGKQITPRQLDNLLLNIPAAKQSGDVIPSENVD